MHFPRMYNSFVQYMDYCTRPYGNGINRSARRIRNNRYHINLMKKKPLLSWDMTWKIVYLSVMLSQ